MAWIATQTTKPTSENEIATIFMAEARKRGWTVYPEHLNWDMVMTRRKLIVGVEVKKKFSRAAFEQTCNRFGVHYKVLVAAASQYQKDFFNLDKLSMEFDVIPIALRRVRKYKEPQFTIPKIQRWMRKRPHTEIWIPKLEVRVQPSIAAPKRLTERAQAELDFEKGLRNNASYEELAEVSGKYLAEFLVRWARWSTAKGRYVVVEDCPSLPSKRLKGRLGDVARRYTGAKTENEATFDALMKLRADREAKRGA